jgi:C1A family cysteine protease
VIAARPGGVAIFPRFAGGTGPEFLGGRRVVGLGWQPDVPDGRDRTLASDAVQKILHGKKLALGAAKKALPSQVDLRPWCPPVEDQGQLGSCTAQAIVGLMEYLMIRSRVPEYVDLSRLFLYKVTRKLLGWTGDTGAYLRSTMKAVVTFGVAPERQWPYQVGRFEDEPDAFLYSYAASFKALNYTRLDSIDNTGSQTLVIAKRLLSAGFPVAFGFPVYSSMGNAPDVPYPTQQDSLLGGHAVLAVGYDDNRMVSGKKVPSLLFRNSWGEGWGEAGYGYLPYAYVEEQMALDLWTIFKEDWIDETQFE